MRIPKTAFPLLLLASLIAQPVFAENDQADAALQAQRAFQASRNPVPASAQTTSKDALIMWISIPAGLLFLGWIVHKMRE